MKATRLTWALVGMAFFLFLGAQGAERSVIKSSEPGGNPPSPSTPKAMSDQHPVQQEKQVRSMQRDDAIREHQRDEALRAQQRQDPLREQQQERQSQTIRAPSVTPGVRPDSIQQPGRPTNTQTQARRQDWKRVFQDSRNVPSTVVQQQSPSSVIKEESPRDAKIEKVPPVRDRQSKEQLQQYLQHRQDRAFRESPARQQEIRTALPERERIYREAAKNTREYVTRSYPEYRRWFDDSFFERHNLYPGYHRGGDNWWRRTNWIVITNWLPWGWGYPMYYDGDYVVSLPPEVDGGGNIFPAGDWLPLGVFAVSEDLAASSGSSLFFQLAVSKAGEIDGTAYMASPDQVFDLDGIVDRATQQVVWRISDDPDSPVLSTGIYNLTQDVATTQVVFPDGSQRTWFLTRISQ